MSRGAGGLATSTTTEPARSSSPKTVSQVLFRRWIPIDTTLSNWSSESSDDEDAEENSGPSLLLLLLDRPPARGSDSKRSDSDSEDGDNEAFLPIEELPQIVLEPGPRATVSSKNSSTSSTVPVADSAVTIYLHRLQESSISSSALPQPSCSALSSSLPTFPSTFSSAPLPSSGHCSASCSFPPSASLSPPTSAFSQVFRISSEASPGLPKPEFLSSPAKPQHRRSVSPEHSFAGTVASKPIPPSPATRNVAFPDIVTRRKARRAESMTRSSPPEGSTSRRPVADLDYRKHWSSATVPPEPSFSSKQPPTRATLRCSNRELRLESARRRSLERRPATRTAESRSASVESARFSQASQQQHSQTFRSQKDQDVLERARNRSLSRRRLRISKKVGASKDGLSSEENSTNLREFHSRTSSFDSPDLQYLQTDERFSSQIGMSSTNVNDNNSHGKRNRFANSNNSDGSNSGNKRKESTSLVNASSFLSPNKFFSPSLLDRSPSPSPVLSPLPLLDMGSCPPMKLTLSPVLSMPLSPSVSSLDGSLLDASSMSVLAPLPSSATISTSTTASTTTLTTNTFLSSAAPATAPTTTVTVLKSSYASYLTVPVRQSASSFTQAPITNSSATFLSTLTNSSASVATTNISTTSISSNDNNTGSIPPLSVHICTPPRKPAALSLEETSTVFRSPSVRVSTPSSARFLASPPTTLVSSSPDIIATPAFATSGLSDEAFGACSSSSFFLSPISPLLPPAPAHSFSPSSPSSANSSTTSPIPHPFTTHTFTPSFASPVHPPPPAVACSPEFYTFTASSPLPITAVLNRSDSFMSLYPLIRPPSALLSSFRPRSAPPQQKRVTFVLPEPDGDAKPVREPNTRFSDMKRERVLSHGDFFNRHNGSGFVERQFLFYRPGEPPTGGALYWTGPAQANTYEMCEERRILLSHVNELGNGALPLVLKTSRPSCSFFIKTSKEDFCFEARSMEVRSEWTSGIDHLLRIGARKQRRRVAKPVETKKEPPPEEKKVSKSKILSFPGSSFGRFLSFKKRRPVDAS